MNGQTVSSATPAPVVPARTAPAARRRRPRSEYWDVASASWRTRGPVVPAPRAGN